MFQFQFYHLEPFTELMRLSLSTWDGSPLRQQWEIEVSLRPQHLSPALIDFPTFTETMRRLKIVRARLKVVWEKSKMFSTRRSPNTTSWKASQISTCWKEEVGQRREGRWWPVSVHQWLDGLLTVTRGAVRSLFTLHRCRIKGLSYPAPPPFRPSPVCARFLVFSRVPQLKQALLQNTY